MLIFPVFPTEVFVEHIENRRDERAENGKENLSQQDFIRAHYRCAREQPIYE